MRIEKTTNKEHWFVAEIYTKKSSLYYREQLFPFIVKIILLEPDDLINFHFFHEDWDKTKMSKELLDKYQHLFPKEKRGYMFLLRIRVSNQSNIAIIKAIFNNNKKIIKGIYTKIKFPKYYGEEQYYSKIGWANIQDYFCDCSRIALLLPKIKAEWFNRVKLVHTFLNQTGYGTDEEFAFHLSRALSIYNNIKLKYHPVIKKAMEELNKFLKKNESNNNHPE